jgi:hypothetical protein
MMNRRTEAAERFADRRAREDGAERLRDVVPDVVACKIELSESRPNSTAADVVHIRHLVVAHAAALVLIACSDPSCKDGGHDISSQLIRGLKDRRAEIRGEDACYGSVGSAECGRILRFHAFAQYTEPK